MVFATISGAHLYGFPSPDSDWDLRGVHVLPLRQVLGLGGGHETHELAKDDGTVELDLITHDIYKFAGLMLKRNGYVLEQLLSPLVVQTSAAHAELVALAPQLFTRHHAYHYRLYGEPVATARKRRDPLCETAAVRLSHSADGYSPDALRHD